MGHQPEPKAESFFRFSDFLMEISGGSLPICEAFNLFFDQTSDNNPSKITMKSTASRGFKQNLTKYKSIYKWSEVFPNHD